MIKRITLKNFQSHKNLVVDCDKFTTLTGPSNGGKSAVLRAILGLARNDSVTDYVRHGQKSLSVKLELDDGFTVEWRKGSGENKYILTDPEGDETVFDKVGTDVPEEVRAILKLGPVAIKGSEKEYVNFHRQLEPPFLVKATAGNVAKLFGELTSASQLYTAVSEGNKEVRSTNSLRKTRKADLAQAQEELHGFDDLEYQQDLLAKASERLSKAGDASKTITGINNLVSDYKARIDEQNEIEERLYELEEQLDVDLDELMEKASRLRELDLLVKAVHNSTEGIGKLQTELDNLEGIGEVDLDTLQDSFERGKLLHTALKQVGKVETDRKNILGELESVTSELEDLDSKIDALMLELDECPTCGEELDEDTKKMLIEGREHAAH